MRNIADEDHGVMADDAGASADSVDFWERELGQFDEDLGIRELAAEAHRNLVRIDVETEESHVVMHSFIAPLKWPF